MCWAGMNDRASQRVRRSRPGDGNKSSGQGEAGAGGARNGALFISSSTLGFAMCSRALACGGGGGGGLRVRLVRTVTAVVRSVLAAGRSSVRNVASYHAEAAMTIRFFHDGDADLPMGSAVGG